MRAPRWKRHRNDMTLAFYSFHANGYDIIQYCSNTMNSFDFDFKFIQFAIYIKIDSNRTSIIRWLLSCTTHKQSIRIAFVYTQWHLAAIWFGARFKSIKAYGRSFISDCWLFFSLNQLARQVKYMNTIQFCFLFFGFEVISAFSYEIRYNGSYSAFTRYWCINSQKKNNSSFIKWEFKCWNKTKWNKQMFATILM